MKRALVFLTFLLLAVPAWASTYFTVSGGNILTPTGQVFVPRGVAMSQVDLPFAVTNAQCQPLTTLFPGVNIVRLAIADFSNGGSQAASYAAGSVANIQAQVNLLIGCGIVVAINDHTTSDHANTGGGAGTNYTSANGLLQPMLNYYQSLATNWLGNPNVWFGSRNEPPNNCQGCLTTEQVATYNAIRATGSGTIIEMEQIGGGIPSNFGTVNMGANNPNGLNPDSAYAAMTGIIWGPHFYNWNTNFSTSVSVNNAEVQTFVGLTSQVTSADGQVPTVFWEYGPGTGATFDAGGFVSSGAVQQSQYGSIAWAYDQFQAANALTNAPGSNTLTQWGTQTAAWLVQFGGVLPPVPNGAVLPPGNFHVVGNQIVAGDGTNVRLACEANTANYYFADPAGNLPGEMNTIRNQQGFNCIRWPYADAVLCPGGVCNFSYADAVVAAAAAANLRVIIDEHSNEGILGNGGCNSQQFNGLWYDSGSPTDGTDGCGTAGTVTYATFKQNWIQIAQHYANDPRVIGYDLHNEPIGGASNRFACWGCGGNNDARFMLNDVGGALNAIDPHKLIIEEGIINVGNLFNGIAKGSPQYPINSIPTDLSTVQSNPPTCCAGQIVYSIHNYPASISGNNPDSGAAAVTMMNVSWGYLVTGNIAPVWIGELAADLDNTNGQLADEQAWAATFSSYVNGNQGSLGGPTFSGCQQPIGIDWWSFGSAPGQVPDGSLNPDGTNRAGQFNVYSTMLYKTCSGGTTPPPPSTTTWNPNDEVNIALTGANLIATDTGPGNSTAATVRTTTSNSNLASQKACFEIAATTISGNWDSGIASSSYSLTNTNGLGSDGNGIGFDPNSQGGAQGIFYNNALVSSGTGTSVNGEAMTFCADFTAKLLWVTGATMRAEAGSHIWNNDTIGNQNPATGTGGMSFSGITCPCFPIFNDLDGSGVATLNTAGPFAVSIPAGFQAWDQPLLTGGKAIVISFP